MMKMTTLNFSFSFFYTLATREKKIPPLRSGLNRKRGKKSLIVGKKKKLNANVDIFKFFAEIY